MTDQDSPWKELLEQDLLPALRLLAPDVTAGLDPARDLEALDAELRKLAPEGETGRRLADRLVKLHLRDGDVRYLHAEVQAWRDDELGRRVFVYNYRARDRFNQPVASLVILVDDDPGWRPSGYADELWGTRTEFTFRVIKLLDWEAREAELWAHENPVAVFVLAQLFSLRTRKDPTRRAERKLQLLRRLRERRTSPDDLRHWYRYLDWLLDLPREYNDPLWAEFLGDEKEGAMPFVTYAEQVGMEKGIKKGMEKGIEKGRELGKLLGAINARLELRFGEAGAEIGPHLDGIADLELLRRIESLSKAGTLDDVRALLPAPPTANGAAGETTP